MSLLRYNVGIILTSEQECLKIMKAKTSSDSDEPLELFRTEAFPNCWTRKAESTSSLGGQYDRGKYS